MTEAFLATEPGPGANVVNLTAVVGTIADDMSRHPTEFGWYPAAKAGILSYTCW